MVREILRKFYINSLWICPPHLKVVATVPGEILKSFSTILYVIDSDYLCYL